MSPAHMFGSHQALMALTEEGSSALGNIPFHHATLPLDASTASLRELYAAAAQLATPVPAETSATFNEGSIRTGDTLGINWFCCLLMDPLSEATEGGAVSSSIRCYVR